MSWRSELCTGQSLIRGVLTMMHRNLKSSEVTWRAAGCIYLRHRKKQHVHWRQVKISCFLVQLPSSSVTSSHPLTHSVALSPFVLKQLFQSPSTSPSFPVQQTEGGCWQTLPLSTKFLPVSGNPFPVRRYYSSTKSIPQEFLYLSHTHTHKTHVYMHLMAVPLSYRSHCACLFSFESGCSPVTLIGYWYQSKTLRRGH